MKLFPVRDFDIMNCFVTSQTGFPFLKEPGSINHMTRLRFKDLPDDHVVTGAFYDLARGCSMIVIEHPSFDEVKHGDHPSIGSAEVEHIYCDHSGKYIGSEVIARL